MDLKTFKPLHGWRAFLGEVGVVVLGVLLALGAQQMVQEIQLRSDERALRQLIDHEIGLNLFVYDVRSRQSECIGKTVNELRDWLDKARLGGAVPAIHARPPLTLTPYRSAWDNRDASVFNHLPLRIRQKYAEFYDEVTNNWTFMQSEQQDWKRLWPYAEPGPLTLQDRRVIRPAIGSIEGWNGVLDANFVISRKIADELGIKSVAPDNIPTSWVQSLSECPSIFAPQKNARKPRG